MQVVMVKCNIHGAANLHTSVQNQTTSSCAGFVWAACSYRHRGVHLLTASINFVVLLYSENKTIALQALQRCLNLLHPCSPHRLCCRATRRS